MTRLHSSHREERGDKPLQPEIAGGNEHELLVSPFAAHVGSSIIPSFHQLGGVLIQVDDDDVPS
jgi:hypothetical protein